MALQPQRKLTYDDYARLPEDRRWELFDGEAFMVPSPDVEHQRILGRLYKQVVDYLELTGGGDVFMAPLDVVLSEHNTYQPDLIFVADADASVITDKHIRGVPTWVVEIISDPVRDLRDKREIYMRFGIPEYWALDPQMRSVTVFRPGAEPVTTSAAQLSPSVLPSLVVYLVDVFGPDKRPRRM